MAAATTGLTGAVAALWKHQVKQSDKLEKKHDQAINNIADLSREVGELKGRIHLAAVSYTHLPLPTTPYV